MSKEEIYFKYSIEKHENDKLRQENEELKERINKAIEYIDNAQTLNYGTIKEFNIKEFPFVQHILEMLKGEENVKN